jgi:hypothetical protein
LLNVRFAPQIRHYSSFFRNSGNSHALTSALGPGTEGRIVTLAQDLIVRRGRDAYTTRFGDTLKSRRDIDAVAKNVMGFDDYVADINAYAEGETLVVSVANREVMDAFLELGCSPNRLDRAPKFCQKPVASVFYDPATMLRDRRQYSVRQEHGQTCVRCLLVIVH